MNTPKHPATEPETVTEPAEETQEQAVVESPAAEEPQHPATEPETVTEPEAAVEAAAVSAMADKAERCFVIVYDTVGSGPSFQKGEVVTAGDVEFLGIERLLAVGAIREA